MPDMPQPGAQAPVPPQAAPGGAPADPAAAGGGSITDALAQVDQALAKITEAVTANPQLGDDVKQGFADALSSFRGASTALAGNDGGGADEQEQPSESGPVSQQGGPGAMPMSHQNMKG